MMPPPERLQRRLHQLVLLLWACALLGSSSVVLGAAFNDYKINSDPGRALAVVTSVTPSRTTVDFQDEQGIYHSPPGGLLYPTGLGEGQRVWVTYSKKNPDLVKVENRAWTLSIIPAASLVGASSIIAAALWWLVMVVMRRFIRLHEAKEARRRPRENLEPHP